MNNKKLGIFLNGINKENPLLVLSIGLCSSLAVTTSIFNGIGMGFAMTFVLLMSELIISLFHKLIPDSIRLPIFIIVIAAFTTIVQLVLAAYLPALSDALGVFLPLIVVNCIIMGRVESFASKSSPGEAVLDSLGMGIGYTWVLCAISLSASSSARVHSSVSRCCRKPTPSGCSARRRAGSLYSALSPH